MNVLQAGLATALTLVDAEVKGVRAAEVHVSGCQPLYSHVKTGDPSGAVPQSRSLPCMCCRKCSEQFQARSQARLALTCGDFRGGGVGTAQHKP
jgi:hypothetical protein